ncbi:DUF3489 domain-containing protein [Dankookia rubra]|uniref:DUF3489 domain-containing protein n=2 Tax=Dankookia rubra TaxID=1442381 RepID=A0A4R5Q950_9PROT|nr:DUF3489 domain-containing protein [Dankookia rubra]
MAAIGAAPAVPEPEAGVTPANAAQEPGSAPLAPAAAPDAHEDPTVTEAAEAPATTAPLRASLRDAAHRVLAAWDGNTDERASLPDAITALRAILVKPVATSRIAGPRQPRAGTKQQQVLAMLRRPEGATVAQIMAATSWQAHTVRGFFAGLKKRQNLAVAAAERVRLVGPGKEGAKGSYTVYRVAKAG